MENLDHVVQFLRCEQAAKAPATVRNRLRALERYDRWLSGRDGTTGATATKLDLAEYVADLREHYPPAHVNIHVSALRVYYRWLADIEARRDNPAHGLRYLAAQSRPTASLASDEVHALLRFASRARAARFGTHRAAVLVLVLVDSGMRIGEALRLRMMDVNLLENHILITATKTRSVRLAPISPTLRPHLLAYLKRRSEHLRARHLGDCGALFVSEQGCPWPVNGAERGCRTVASLAGLTRRLHPHLLRHTWATLSLINGAPMPAVMMLGGWRKLATVQRYTQMSARQLADVQASSSPLGRASQLRLIA